MRFELGAQVMARHAVSAGQVERLVVDPESRQLLCLVVHRGGHIGYDVLLPPHSVARTSPGVIWLRIDVEWLEPFPGLIGGLQDILSGLRVPHIQELPGPIGWPTPHAFLFPKGLSCSNLPGKAIELANSTAVFARDGMLGTMAGVLVETNATLSSLIVRVGRISRKDILVPIAWVRHLDGVEIELDRTRDDVRRLWQPADVSTRG